MESDSVISIASIGARLIKKSSSSFAVEEDKVQDD
jgi:hypothetical protein